jgi:hypothetical protein
MAVGSREDARPRRGLDPYKEAIGGISAFSLSLYYCQYLGHQGQFMA